MSRRMPAVGVMLAGVLMLSACVVEKVPRDIIEPLPEGLAVAGAQDIEPGRIGGWELCMVIASESGARASHTLRAVTEHLYAMGWRDNPLQEDSESDGVALLRPDEGAGRLWAVEEYLASWPTGECTELIHEVGQKADFAVLLHVYW